MFPIDCLEVGTMQRDPDSCRYKGRYAEAELRYGPKPNVRDAVAAYCWLAGESGMGPVELALRFVLSNPQVQVAVIGASNEQ